jgi:non-specific protein-tyrosine kinase
VDLRRQIAIIRTWLPLFVVSVALAAGVAFLVSSRLPKTYEAQAKLLVGQSISASNPDYTQILVSQRLATTYVSVAASRPTLDAVIKDLGLNESADDLAKRVRAAAPLDSVSLTITSQDTDPARAAAVANSVAEHLVASASSVQGRQGEIQSFIDTSLKDIQAEIQSTQARVDALNAQKTRTVAEDAELTSAQARLTSLRATFASLLAYFSGTASNVLTIQESAIAPTDPISPKVLLYTLVAAVIGLLLAGGVVAVAERLDDSIRDPEMIEEVAGLSTLGTIARMRGGKERNEMYRLAAILSPRSSVAEAYRTLRTNIEFSSVDAPIQTLLITSAIPGEGKTVTAANLAVVFAQAGRRVILVDADLRKPGIHLVFDLPNAHGFTTLLRSDEARLDEVAQPTEQENLRILTTGPLPPNPAELIASQRMRVFLDRLSSSEDLIIFDSPPLQAVTDAAILSAQVDGTILVVDAARSRRRGVRQARAALAKANATVFGAVLNRVPVRARGEDLGYYGDAFAPRDADVAGGGSDASPEMPGASARGTR